MNLSESIEKPYQVQVVISKHRLELQDKKVVEDHNAPHSDETRHVNYDDVKDMNTFEIILFCAL